MERIGRRDAFAEFVKKVNLTQFAAAGLHVHTESLSGCSHFELHPSFGSIRFIFKIKRCREPRISEARLIHGAAAALRLLIAWINHTKKRRLWSLPSFANTHPLFDKNFTISRQPETGTSADLARGMLRSRGGGLHDRLNFFAEVELTVPDIWKAR